MASEEPGTVHHRFVSYGMGLSMSISLLAVAYLRGYSDAYPGTTAEFASTASQSFGAPMFAVAIFVGGMLIAAAFQAVIIYIQWRAGDVF